MSLGMVASAAAGPAISIYIEELTRSSYKNFLRAPQANSKASINDSLPVSPTFLVSTSLTIELDLPSQRSFAVEAHHSQSHIGSWHDAILTNNPSAFRQGCWTQARTMASRSYSTANSSPWLLGISTAVMGANSSNTTMAHGRRPLVA